MSAHKPQMGTRSEDIWNTAQSSRVKSSAVSQKFSEINTYGNKLKLKNDNSFRLMFENANSIPPIIGYFPTSWKYKRLRCIHNRFQVDVLNLVETQINPILAPHTFSMKKKILQGKGSVSIKFNNSNELLGMRQQGAVFTCASSKLTKTVTETLSDVTGLGRWN